MPVLNRWWMAIAGVCLQMALGAAYAWSVFRIPLSKEFGWSITEVTWTFLISWFFLGCSTVVGGLWMKSKGPRVVAMVAGLLWGGGVFLASFSSNRLWWLYLTYGVIGGIGLGMGYIVPITVLVKWFPDHRGLITGIAVAGFGAGALFAAPAAGWLMRNVGLMPTFAYLGVAYALVAVASGAFMQNPPEGWEPEGWTPSAAQISQRSDRDFTLGQALRTWQWWAICLLMSINTMSGLSIVSQASPIFQEMGKATAATAAGLVGVVALFNGAGRIFWSWVSDLTNRKAAFFMMYLVEVALFWSYHAIHSLSLLAGCHFRRGHVLRRRLWDHAGNDGRLFWASRRRLHFRLDDVALGLCSGLWAAALRVSASDQRKLYPGSLCDCGSHDGGAHPAHSNKSTEEPETQGAKLRPKFVRRRNTSRRID